MVVGFMGFGFMGFGFMGLGFMGFGFAMGCCFIILVVFIFRGIAFVKIT